METSAIQQIKQRAARLLDNRFLQTGQVLEVRYWQPCTIIEVDLHLPLINMAQWNEVPYIKFKVADFTFRDYTPSCWDIETHTCTLFIDAAHQGPGSLWAQTLTKGDTVSYIKSGSSRQSPVDTSAVIALGDESSIGHFLALQQMVLPANRFTGAIALANQEHRALFSQYLSSPLETIPRDDKYGHHNLIQWVMKQRYTLENTVFYIAGNNTMVSGLRKLLKQQGYASSQIKAQGFWG